MYNMDDTDDIPVRDVNTNNNKNDPFLERAAQQKNMVSRWSRDDLEDQYLRMYEENLVLKKHARKQEDKIKRMATKLLRLVSDKKKHEAQEGGGGKTRDIETEEMLEELHGRIRELEKNNTLLKDKMRVLKLQLATQGSRKTPYGHVQSRLWPPAHKPDPKVDQRLSKSYQKNMRVTGPPPPNQQAANRTPQPPLPRYGHSLLEEARAENKHLESVIEQQNEQLNIYEQDIDMLKEQLRVREAEYEEDLVKIKQQISAGQRTAIQENIDVIRLQREVKEKGTKLTQLQAQYHNLDEKLRSVKTSHDAVLREMEALNGQLKHEQNRVLGLQNELKAGTASQRNVIELQEHVTDLEKECEILKEANEKLVTSAFDLEREREWRAKENALKVQIAQLEATLKADVGEKGSILDKLSEEKENHIKLEEDHSSLRQQYYELKQQHDDLTHKMSFFTTESQVDFSEIEDALMLIKARKEETGHKELDFLQRVDDEKDKDCEKLVRELQAEHADTINELEKTRNMLIVQHKINKDYQMEVDSVTQKMEELKSEYEEKLEEFAQLLDIRAARIRKLEGQLRDVAYGTRQYRIAAGDGADDEDDADIEAVDETLRLERGQNLFEIHVTRVSLTPEALRQLGDEEPCVFCTWEFFEFEIQSTPVVRGPRPEYEFTSQYLVRVDDFFLHYLQKDSCTLELHQSFGTDFRTLAACQLKMRDILDRSHARYNGTAQLIGVVNGLSGVSLGTVDYWVRLKVPMEQALRLYKERSKALGYLDSNVRGTEQTLAALDELAAQRPPDNINELTVTVRQCAGVQGRRQGIQPSPYCVYKFFDFGDHDSNIVAGSNNPQFHDSKTYPVAMTADLDKYLKSQSLSIYVFDDTDPEEAAYLGVAKLPLLPLAHDKPIKGTIELHAMDGSVNGTMDVSLRWRFTYVPPRGSTLTAAQAAIRGGTQDKPEKLHLLPGEEEALQASVIAGAPGVKTPSKKPPRGPGAASTPKPPRKQPPPQEEDVDMLRPLTPEAPRGSQPPSTPSINIQATDDEGSVVSEGTPVPGESDAVTSDEEDEEDETPGTVQAERGLPAPHQPDEMPEAEEEEEEEVVTPRPHTAPHEDTMFTDAKEEDSGDEAVSEVEDDLDTADDTEGDSEIVMASPTSRPQSQLGHTQGQGDRVILTVGHVTFHPDAAVHEDDSVKKVFVEYRFLDVPPEETETPFALPKPKPNGQCNFNFTKVFHVDFESAYERRQYLASMLLPDDPEQGRIRFTVVSEPDDDEGDCDDVGHAFVSLPEILAGGSDLEDHDLPLYDIEDESLEIGNLNVTIKCIDALMAVKLEMAAEHD